jgi:hypothetical protein
MKKLKVGAQNIPIEYHSSESLCSLFPSACDGDNEVLMGIWSGFKQKIFLNAAQDEEKKFVTLVHEIGEMINDQYGLELDHVQITSFCKVFADIFMLNSKELKKLF